MKRYDQQPVGSTAAKSSEAGGGAIADLPVQERPRERLVRLGPEALTEAELIAILLRTGRRGRSVLDVARDLLHRFDNDLDRLSRADIDELAAVRGIGMAKAVELRAAFALARRLLDLQGRDLPAVNSPEEVARFMGEVFRGVRQEEFHVLFLDTRNHLIGQRRITVGLLDRSHIHAREVFREAIKASARSVILVHNHPSGDPTPSPEDIATTRNLIEAGKIVGIEVLDHVIIGRRTRSHPEGYVSLKRKGAI